MKFKSVRNFLSLYYDHDQNPLFCLIRLSVNYSLLRDVFAEMSLATLRMSRLSPALVRQQPCAGLRLLHTTTSLNKVQAGKYRVRKHSILSFNCPLIVN